MALFDSYIESRRSNVRATSKSFAVAVAGHLFIILTILAFPLLYIKSLPPPAVPLGIFEAAPPPPPPPPPPGGSNAPIVKPKEKEKPKDVLKEPTKPPEEIKDEKPGPPIEGGQVGGVEGGVAGGVVGGVVGALPGKMLVQAQRKLSGDDPYFPPAARTQGITGTVVARVCISDSGKVTSVKILRGVPIFNESVERAVIDWRYEPYMANNTAVPACFPVYFNFNLKK